MPISCTSHNSRVHTHSPTAPTISFNKCEHAQPLCPSADVASGRDAPLCGVCRPVLGGLASSAAQLALRGGCVCRWLCTTVTAAGLPRMASRQPFSRHHVGVRPAPWCGILGEWWGTEPRRANADRPGTPPASADTARTKGRRQASADWQHMPLSCLAPNVWRNGLQ
jgi:hypothetical protein